MPAPRGFGRSALEILDHDVADLTRTIDPRREDIGWVARNGEPARASETRWKRKESPGSPAGVRGYHPPAAVEHKVNRRARSDPGSALRECHVVSSAVVAHRLFERPASVRNEPHRVRRIGHECAVGAARRSRRRERCPGDALRRREERRHQKGERDGGCRSREHRDMPSPRRLGRDATQIDDHVSAACSRAPPAEGR